MEGWVIGFAFVISLIATSWHYLGGFATVLIIAGIIFAIYKLLKSTEKKSNEQYENSDYVKRVWPFIEFCQSLPFSTASIIITPRAICARSFDDDLGLFISSYHFYLSEPQLGAGRFWQDPDHVRKIGGEDNVKRFRNLGLDTKLLNNDTDYPVIHMYAYCDSASKGREYAAAIERLYTRKYGKKLTVYFDEDFMKGELL